MGEEDIPKKLLAGIVSAAATGVITYFLALVAQGPTIEAASVGSGFGFVLGFFGGPHMWRKVTNVAVLKNLGSKD